MLKKRTTRTVLPADTPVPSDAPLRRADSQGYVVLAWTTAPYTEVWVYEHRVRNGRTLPADVHAHHVNGIKSDNRPANLQYLSTHEHTALHHPRAFDHEEAAALYRNGMRTPRLAALFNVAHSAVVRALQKQGVQFRRRWDEPAKRTKYPPRDPMTGRWTA